MKPELVSSEEYGSLKSEEGAKLIVLASLVDDVVALLRHSFVVDLQWYDRSTIDRNGTVGSFWDATLGSNFECLSLHQVCLELYEGVPNLDTQFCIGIPCPEGRWDWEIDACRPLALRRSTYLRAKQFAATITKSRYFNLLTISSLISQYKASFTTLQAESLILFLREMQLIPWVTQIGSKAEFTSLSNETFLSNARMSSVILEK